MPTSLVWLTQIFRAAEDHAGLPGKQSFYIKHAAPTDDVYAKRGCDIFQGTTFASSAMAGKILVPKILLSPALNFVWVPYFSSFVVDALTEKRKASESFSTRKT